MTVFHGSNKEIQLPDVSFSKNYLDFGKEFYLTTYQNQAEKWAFRKAARYSGKPTVNVYTLTEDFSQCRILRFDNLNEAYDIIIGNVANDDVFKTVDMYFRGLWDKKRTIEELRYYKMNDQI